VGRDSSFSTVTCYGRSGDKIPAGSRFFAPIQTGPGAHQPSYTMGTGSPPRRQSGRNLALTTHPHNAEVKERVQLYLYSPSEPLWPVLGWNSPVKMVSVRVETQTCDIPIVKQLCYTLNHRVNFACPIPCTFEPRFDIPSTQHRTN
jgi:hypothetical protein